MDDRSFVLNFMDSLGLNIYTVASPSGLLMQVELDDVEQYRYDGEAEAKAEELGKPGLVTIKERQVGIPHQILI